MAYEKQIWENLPSTNTPVSADRLNHMEDGIYDANEGLIEVHNSYSTSTSDSYSANYVNGLNGTILWTNPNPTADFAEQTITLSSSDYDVLEWYFRSDVSTNLTFCQKSLKNYGTQFVYSSQGSGSRHWIRRIYWVNNTQFSCADCIRVDGTSTSGGNEQDVPLYVVGYKTGLFD